jgi:hypothetical protein
MLHHIPIMINKEPTIDSSEPESGCSLQPFDLGRIAIDPERVRAMTTPLESEPKEETRLEFTERIKATPATGAEVFHYRNLHGR